MKWHYKIAALVLVLVVNTNLYGKRVEFDKTKTVKREFNGIGSDVEIRLNNRYGRVEVTTWDQNNLVIEVDIQVTHTNEKKGQEELDNVDIEFVENSVYIQAKTNLYGRKRATTFATKNLKKEIVYRVKMPVGNNLNVMNRFGDVTINELKGKATIDLSYGALSVGKLSNSKNRINLKFAQNSSISSLQGGSLSAQYSGLTIAQCDQLNMTSQFSQIDIEQVKEATVVSKYDKLNVDECENLKLDAQFSTTKIERLTSKALVTSNYGYLRLDKISSSCQEIRLHNKFGKVRLGFEAPALEFRGTIMFADLDLPHNWDVSEESIQHTKKYNGIVNGGGTQVSVTGQYGNISISQN
ncbi:MAG: hypothetical protein JJ975_13010 [Bacteroidia bacterium]|nr:hypothetical protein [Bacteroidia bacterium]